MTRHLVVLVALLFVAESHSMGFKRRKLQSGSEAGAPRELRRAEGKGAGKRSGDDAPAATAAGAGSTAPAALVGLLEPNPLFIVLPCKLLQLA